MNWAWRSTNTKLHEDMIRQMHRQQSRCGLLFAACYRLWNSYACKSLLKVSLAFNPETSGSLIRSDRMEGVGGWFVACCESCCGKLCDRPFCAQSGRLHALAKPYPRLRWLPIPHLRTSVHIVGTEREFAGGQYENHGHRHRSPDEP